MTTSLYYSVGVVDAVEWACVLCGCHIQNDWVEQWICIQFCVKLKHSPMETIPMSQKASEDNAMSAVQVKVWHQCFKDDWESVESDAHSGRPETSRNIVL